MTSLSQASIIDVWRALGGPEPKGRRAPAWWRDSRDPNISIDAERAVFFDHVHNSGGGVLVLVQTVLKCNRAGALTWLERQGFIEARTFTHEQQREHARRRGEVRSVAQDIAYWRHTFAEELNKRKVIAAAANDCEALGYAAALCNLLENGSPEDIIREFIRAQGAEPEGVARYVATGKQREFEDSRLTAEVVLLLARRVVVEASGRVV